MSVNDLNGSILRDVVVAGGSQIQSMTQTLTGALTLAPGLPPLQYMDPGGAGRDVLLPAEASSSNVFLIIVNIADAAESLTVKEDSDTTTISTIAQSKAAILHCDGTTWREISLLA